MKPTLDVELFKNVTFCIEDMKKYTLLEGSSKSHLIEVHRT